LSNGAGRVGIVHGLWNGAGRIGFAHGLWSGAGRIGFAHGLEWRGSDWIAQGL
jgi:hypothetical protein